MNIDPISFIISVIITIFLLCLICPLSILIIKEPNIKYDISDMYLDDNGVCYKYYKTQVKCEPDKHIINNNYYV